MHVFAFIFSSDGCNTRECQRTHPVRFSKRCQAFACRCRRGIRNAAKGILKQGHKIEDLSSYKYLVNKALSRPASGQSVELRRLKTTDELVFLGKKLTRMLHTDVSHAAFAAHLNEIMNLFLFNSPTNEENLAIRWLYVFYECFCAAYTRKLWVQAGLLLCAVVTIEGASCDNVGQQRLVLYRNEVFSDDIRELATAATDEFGSAFLYTAVCYINSSK